jgi:hypothetical protein
MNILRIIFAVLAIMLLFVSMFSILNPDNVQLAISPIVCFFFGYVVACHFERDDSRSGELTTAPKLLATRAPPRS